MSDIQLCLMLVLFCAAVIRTYMYVVHLHTRTHTLFYSIDVYVCVCVHILYISILIIQISLLHICLCCFQVLCNALWYITNQQQVINDAAQRKRNVLPIPQAFAAYVGYNNLKRKKLKSQPMTATELNSHGQALFSLLLKPVVNSSSSWKIMAQDIQELGESLLSCKEHLNDQLRVQTTNQELDHPVRTIGEHATLEHVDTPFVNSTQKFRFLKEMHLSVPIDIIRFCPGGSENHDSWHCEVQDDRPENQVLTQGARLLQQMQPQMKEFHTRMQKREFKTKVNNLSCISPALTEFLYRYLTLDASAAANTVMQHRMHLISMGHTGIVADLRTLTCGRPGVYDPFFEKLEEVVEEATAADDRRHNVAHISEWISLNPLVAVAPGSTHL